MGGIGTREVGLLGVVLGPNQVTEACAACGARDSGKLSPSKVSNDATIASTFALVTFTFG